MLKIISNTLQHKNVLPLFSFKTPALRIRIQDHTKNNNIDCYTCIHYDPFKPCCKNFVFDTLKNNMRINHHQYM